jgi:Reverse transcriptase (RNA-dependent DNA polymerase)
MFVILQILHSRNYNSMRSAKRPYHSIETALNRTLNDVNQSTDHGEPTLLVYLDLGAAFDTTDHSSLLCRLNASFGVSDTALSWLASYLSGRSQAVHIGSKSSPTTNCAWCSTRFCTRTHSLYYFCLSRWSSCFQLSSKTQAVRRRCAATHFSFSSAASPRHRFSHNGLSLNPSTSDVVFSPLVNGGRHLSLFHTSTSLALRSSCPILLLL